MKQTQKQMILTWLREGNSITSLEALKYFGCSRLAARICDLKNDGHSIKTEMIDVDVARIARYRLDRTLSI